jgi:hypothetical protein
VLLEIIGAFGLGFGGKMDSMEYLAWDCVFFFPLPICLISLGSLRWATALMWIDLIVLCLCNLSLSKAYFNPFNDIRGAMFFSPELLITIAFLVVAAGRWKGNTGLIKLIHSLNNGASD